MGLIINRRKRINDNLTLTLGNTGPGAVAKFGPISISSRGRVTLHLAKGISFRIFG